MAGNPAWGEWKITTSGINSATGAVTYYPPNETLWTNGLYTVHVTKLDGGAEGCALHLSIRHKDRKAIHDWRHFQRIKNEIAGSEREGVEIYPPESQLVDGANQYHLWILPEGSTTPFTWHEGRQVGNDSASTPGAVQRPYDTPESGA